MQSGGSTGEEVVRQSPDGGGETRTVLIASGQVESGASGEPGLAPGTRMGRYRIHSLLGRGGMGEVYRAEQLEPVRRDVAIKLVRGQRLDLQQLAWFEVERQVLAGLHHPAIAQVFDAGATDDGHPYFVMEYIQGEPITRYCESRQLSLRQRIVLMVMVCDGVQHAHQKGVIHRDLKPANLLVEDADGRAHPKLIDFGIATPGGRAMARLQGEAGAVGTPAYMSPEQGDASQSVDVRSDVYSLGVVLSQLITGQRPEGSESGSGGVNTGTRTRRRPSELLRGGEVGSTQQRAQALGLSPRSFKRVLRSELDWVVLKATRHERDQRYASAAELAEDLRAFLDGRPLRAVPATGSYRAGKILRRHAPLFALSALVLLSLVGGLAAALYGLAQAESREQALMRVSAFQQSMLTRLDTERMGASLLRLQREQLDHLDPVPPGEAGGATDWLARLDATGLAAGLLHEHLLEPSLAAVQAEFADEPGVAAHMEAAVASIYREALGDYARSAEAFERAASRYEAGVDRPTRDDAVTWLSRAAAEREAAGEVERAQALLARAEGMASGLPPESVARAHLQFARARLAMQAGRDAEALGHARAVREQLEPGISTMPAAHLQLLAWAVVLEATALERMDRLSDSIALVEGFTEAFSGQLDSRTLGSLRQRLAIEYMRSRRPSEAVPIQRDLFEWARRELGHAHSRTLSTGVTLGGMLVASGEYEEASVLLASLLPEQVRARGAGHPEVLRTQVNLAASQVRLGRHAAALPITEEVFVRRRESLGAEHPLTLSVMGSYSDSLRRNGRLAEALEVGRELARIRAATLEPTHLEYLQSHEHLAVILETLGRYRESLEIANALLEIVEADSSRGEDQILTLVLVRKAIGLAGIGRSEEAQRLMDDRIAPALGNITQPGIQRDVIAQLRAMGLAVREIDHDSSRRVGRD